MDALAIEAAEAAVHCGYPEGAAAVLLVELDGPAAEVEAELATVRALCEQAGAREIRAADDPAQRAGIWAGRKSAFAAVGRAVPRLHRAGRRGAAHGARRRARPHRQAVGRDRDPGRERVPRRRREPAPAGALQRRRARRGGAGGTRIRRHPRHVHRVRRVDHRRARRRGGQVPVHAQDVQRRGPGHDAAGAVRVRPRGRCATRARSSRPRGYAVRSQVTAAVPAPPRPTARRSSNEVPNERVHSRRSP